MIPSRHNPAPLRKKLRWALTAYAAIATAAGLTVEGPFLWIVWIFLAGLALKSWIAVRREELD